MLKLLKTDHTSCCAACFWSITPVLLNKQEDSHHWAEVIKNSLKDHPD